MRRFELHRDEDVSGVSGTGVVAEGVAFSNDGPVALRWTSNWPTSVVFHDKGIESLEAVHGHNGRTRIVWIDEEPRPEWREVILDCRCYTTVLVEDAFLGTLKWCSFHEKRIPITEILPPEGP